MLRSLVFSASLTLASTGCFSHADDDAPFGTLIVEVTTTVADRLSVYAFDVTVSAVDFPSDSFL